MRPAVLEKKSLRDSESLPVVQQQTHIRPISWSKPIRDSEGRPKNFENHCTRASLHSDTVEDLIRISVEGPSLEDFDARESVASWFSQGQRSRRPNYRSWLSEGHVTAMEDSP